MAEMWDTRPMCFYCYNLPTSDSNLPGAAASTSSLAGAYKVTDGGSQSSSVDSLDWHDLISRLYSFLYFLSPPPLPSLFLFLNIFVSTLHPPALTAPAVTINYCSPQPSLSPPAVSPVISVLTEISTLFKSNSMGSPASLCGAIWIHLTLVTY